MLLTKYYLGDQIKRNVMGGHVARMGRESVLVWKPEGKNHLGD
jgi:hypothetical protein